MTKHRRKGLDRNDCPITSQTMIKSHSFTVPCHLNARHQKYQSQGIKRIKLCAASARQQCSLVDSIDGSHDSSPSGDSVSRRSLGWMLPLTASWLMSSATSPEAQAFSIPSMSFNPSSPEPVRIPRSRLNQQFAVLLMRSVYDAVDELDFISMSDFQAKFWKLRQSLYEPYLLQYRPLQIKQGDLQDPAYFDFISFAQMATVNQEYGRGKQVFEEFCEDCPDQKKVVTRSPRYKDNSKLPAAVEQLAGDNIYRGLRDGFRGVDFGAPTQRAAGTHIEELAKDVQLLMDIFVRRGYALKAKVDGVSGVCSQGSCEYHGANGSQGSFQIKVEGPANLWGMAALANRGSPLNTAYSALAVDGFLRASNVTAEYSVDHTETVVTHHWALA